MDHNCTCYHILHWKSFKPSSIVVSLEAPQITHSMQLDGGAPNFNRFSYGGEEVATDWELEQLRPRWKMKCGRWRPQPRRTATYWPNGIESSIAMQLTRKAIDECNYAITVTAVCQSDRFGLTRLVHLLPPIYSEIHGKILFLHIRPPVRYK